MKKEAFGELVISNQESWYRIAKSYLCNDADCADAIQNAIVHAFENATGVAIKYELGARRAGDLPEFWANADKAAQALGWRAKRNLTNMCQDTWRWQSENPKGYRSKRYRINCATDC